MFEYVLDFDNLVGLGAVVVAIVTILAQGTDFNFLVQIHSAMSSGENEFRSY